MSEDLKTRLLLCAASLKRQAHCIMADAGVPDGLDSDMLYAAELLRVAAYAGEPGLLSKLERNDFGSTVVAVPAAPTGLRAPAASASVEHRHDYGEDGKCKGCGAPRKRRPRGSAAEPPADTRTLPLTGAR